MEVIWQNIELFTILFARTSAFIFVLPVLGNRNIPVHAKIGLSVFVSFFLFPVMRGIEGSLPEETIPFILIVIKEVLVGLALGFITKFLFAGVQIAGEAVGRQMGFGMARVMDPGSQEQVSLVGDFQVVVVFLIYLAIDGHHFLLRGLVESYQKVPIAEAVIGRGIENHVVNMASGMFLSGVKIGAPVIVALLLTTIALGILARTVPQMNVFIVGLPLKIGVGILALILTMTLFMHVFRHLWIHFQNDFIAFLELFSQ